MSVAASQRNSKHFLWLALLIGFVLSLLFQLPVLRDPTLVDEDLRFLYWIHRYADPELLQNDPVFGYQMAELDLGFTNLVINKVNLAYGLIFAVLGAFIEPILLSKLLVFPLTLVSIWLLFRIGEQIMPPLSVFIMCILFTVLAVPPHSELSLSSGLQRSFTLPLLLALFYVLTVKGIRAQALVLFLTILYPPIFLLAAVAMALTLVVPLIRQRHLTVARNDLLLLTAAGLAGALLLLPAATTGQNNLPVSSGRFPSTTVFESPLYGEDGRYPLLSPRAISANGGIIDSGVLGLFTLLLLVASFLSWLVLRSRAIRLPAAFWTVFWASLICYILSWLPILFTTSAFLHMPSRYPRGVLFLMGLVYVMANGPAALQHAAGALVRPGGLAIWLLPGLGVLLTAVTFSLYGLGFATLASIGLTLILVLLTLIKGRQAGRGDPRPAASPSKDESIDQEFVRPSLVVLTAVLVALPMLFIIPVLDARLHRPSTAVRPMLAYLETLPKDGLIAGYPCSLNDVPLYAKRAVLFSCETENRDMDLMVDLFEAYYAEDEQQVHDFCRHSGVDYLVVNEQTFSLDFVQSGKFMYEPIRSTVPPLLEGHSNFVLATTPEDERLFQDGSLFVISCG